MTRGAFDVVVVGAGIVGLATARELLARSPGLRLAVVEKEPEVARHQSGHNSGVLHAGLYYRPGSLKARLCREGKALLERYAADRGLPVRQSGKLVVAADESELPRLEELRRRGSQNGIEGLLEIDARGIAEIEPHAVGVRALHVPETAVVDFAAVARAYAEDVRSAGGEVVCGAEVTRIVRDDGRRVVATTAGEFHTRLLVGCAGLHADRVAALDGRTRRSPRLVPFRGSYYTFRPHAERLVRGLLYPVPDPRFPFLGVHFTRTIDDRVLAGPNALVALAREGYGRRNVSLGDTLETIRYPGFWRLCARHVRTGAAELWRDASKAAFVRDMQRYLPEVGADDVVAGPAGVRSQFLERDGTLLDDFLVDGGAGSVHVLNAPSPAATSSLAIGRHLADVMGFAPRPSAAATVV